MRFAMLTALAFVLLAAQARAVTITQVGGDGSHSVGDTITVNYYLDNLGSPGISVMGFAVKFNPAVLSYVGGTVQNKILKASDDEGGNPPHSFGGLARLSSAPILFDPEGKVLFAWSSAPAPAWSEVSAQFLGSVQFRVNAVGPAGIVPAMGPGTGLGQYEGTYANPGAVDIRTGDVLFTFP